MKLVRDHGGEAIADTSWSVITEFRRSDPRERRRLCLDGAGGGRLHHRRQEQDRIYQRDFTVEAGHNQEVEVLATETTGTEINESAD